LDIKLDKFDPYLKTHFAVKPINLYYQTLFRNVNYSPYSFI
jgi:hypothetical protein